MLFLFVKTLNLFISLQEYRYRNTRASKRNIIVSLSFHIIAACCSGAAGKIGQEMYCNDMLSLTHNHRHVLQINPIWFLGYEQGYSDTNMSYMKLEYDILWVMNPARRKCAVIDAKPSTNHIMHNGRFWWHVWGHWRWYFSVHPGHHICTHGLK